MASNTKLTKVEASDEWTNECLSEIFNKYIATHLLKHLSVNSQFTGRTMCRNEANKPWVFIPLNGRINLSSINLK